MLKWVVHILLLRDGHNIPYGTNILSATENSLPSIFIITTHINVTFTFTTTKIVSKEEVRSNQPFTTSDGDDDAIEVQYAGWYQ